MGKEQQNYNWAHLPSDLRRDIKDRYNGFCQNSIDQSKPHALGARFLLEDLFGRDNLTSATEPEEMLMVERKSVQELYVQNEKNLKDTNDNWFAGYMTALEDSFGDKCLPDELEQTLEQTSVQVEDKPKFKVGDKVRIVNVPNPMMRDEIGIVTEYLTNDSHLYKVKWCEDSESFIEDCYLEPYTEEESRNLSQEVANYDKPNANQLNDMEEKELNLGELLKDSIGEKFFHPTYGEITLENIGDNHLLFAIDGGTISAPKRIITKTGYVFYYPSEESFRQYPLDGFKAWKEWIEENITEVSITFDYGVNGYPDVAPPKTYTFPNEDECKDFLREVDKAMEEIYNRRKEAANG